MLSDSDLMSTLWLLSTLATAIYLYFYFLQWKWAVFFSAELLWICSLKPKHSVGEKTDFSYVKHKVVVAYGLFLQVVTEHILFLYSAHTKVSEGFGPPLTYVYDPHTETSGLVWIMQVCCKLNLCRPIINVPY